MKTSVTRRPSAALAAIVLSLGCRAVPPSEATDGAAARGRRGLPVPAVFAPSCSKGGDLTGQLAGFDDLPLNVVRVIPRKAAVLRAIKEAPGPWLMFLFSGHGRGAEESDICLQDGFLSVRCMVQALQSVDRGRVKGAVFVLNACESAAVDPSPSAIPLSIISASPGIVRADSLFGESLSTALALAAEDWNCDGVVTDQEFFDALVAVLDRSAPRSLRPSLPKIRRQASSEIPLPVEARARRACQGVRRSLAELVQRYGAQWGDLGTALERQLRLGDRTGAPHDLPEGSSDYFFLSGTKLEPDERSDVERAAKSARLSELPDSAIPYAEQIARFSSFGDIYRLEAACGFIRVHRLRDGAVVGSEKIADLAPALPRREMLSFPGVLFSGAVVLRRVLGPAEPTSGAAPCYEQTGQCFQIPAVGQEDLQRSP